MIKGFLKGTTDVVALHRRIEQLCGEGVADSDIVMGDSADAVIDGLEAGDRLVVCSLGDLSNGLLGLVRIMNRIASRGAVLVSLEERWLEMKPGDGDFARLMEGLARFGGEAVASRTKQALEKRRREGNPLGRPKNAATTKRRMYDWAIELYTTTDKTVREICRTTGIDTRSFYRELRASGDASERRRGSREGGKASQK
ncbi:MAG: recombinase family protein [Rikenellaceae bacterium]|nr:recombinase family protein [Rikenellaceae bacterium]